MHIKFLRHGTGDPYRAVRYLLADKDHNGLVRPRVKVLRGQPEIVAALVASSAHVHRYTSCVIAWAPEDRASDEEVDAVLDDFESLAFAGLESDQYAYFAVSHGEHVHVLVARQELRTGKSMNVAPPTQRLDFDHLRDHWNYKMGWGRPDDPDRARHVQPGDLQKRRLSKDKQISAEAQELGISVSDLQGVAGEEVDTKTVVADTVLRQVIEGSIKNRDDVLVALGHFGAVTRVGENYISIKSRETGKSMRFKGAMFERSFDAAAFLSVYQRPAPMTRGQPDPRKAEEARLELDAAMERRARYNRERYSVSKPELLNTSNSADEVPQTDFIIPSTKDDDHANRNHDLVGRATERPARPARTAIERIVAAAQRAADTIFSMDRAMAAVRSVVEYVEERRAALGLVGSELNSSAAEIDNAAAQLGASTPSGTATGGSEGRDDRLSSDVASAVGECVAACQQTTRRAQRVRAFLDLTLAAVTLGQRTKHSRRAYRK